MKSFHAMLAAGIVAIGCAVPAGAAAYTIAETFDLNTATIDPRHGFSVSGSVAMTTLDVQAGDMIKYSVSFAAGQSVTLQYINTLSAYLSGTSSGSALPSQTLPSQSGHLLVKGPNQDLALTASTANNDILGLGYIYDPMIPDPFGLDYVELTGLEWDGTFNTDGVYSFAGFTMSGDDGFVTLAQDSVPEPASWIMMIGGFGLIGVAARHRRPGARLIARGQA